MPKPPAPAKRRTSRPFPWLLLLLLIGSIYVLWVLPNQLGARRIMVDFSTPPTTAKS